MIKAKLICKKCNKESDLVSVNSTGTLQSGSYDYEKHQHEYNALYLDKVTIPKEFAWCGDYCLECYKIHLEEQSAKSAITKAERLKTIEQEVAEIFKTKTLHKKLKELKAKRNAYNDGNWNETMDVIIQFIEKQETKPSRTRNK